MTSAVTVRWSRLRDHEERSRRVGRRLPRVCTRSLNTPFSDLNGGLYRSVEEHDAHLRGFARSLEEIGLHRDRNVGVEHERGCDCLGR